MRRAPRVRRIFRIQIGRRANRLRLSIAAGEPVSSPVLDVLIRNARSAFSELRPFVVREFRSGLLFEAAHSKGDRVGGAGDGRGAWQAVVAACAPRVAACERAREQLCPDAVAPVPAQGRPSAAVAAGSAHRRRHPRERNLFRPLRLCRQGRDLATAARRSRWRRPPTNGRRNCAASAGCAICAPPIRRSPAPMPVRWWMNGSRFQGRWNALALAARCADAPDHLAGSARRR